MDYTEHLFLLGGITLLLFFCASYVFQRLKLPSLLAFIFLGVLLAGLLTGPEFELVDNIAKFGIVLLFFLLGLHFPLARLVNISRRVWKVGILDIGFNFGGSALIAHLLGFDLLTALIVGGVAYATSSSITVKMLEETGRMRTPEGEFKLALLIFEDLVAPIMVSLLIGLSAQGTVSAPAIGAVFLKVALVAVLAILFAHYGFRRLDVFVSRHLTRDFIPMFSIAIALVFAGIAHALDLSKLLGAFLAGVMLSETGTSRELGKLIGPIKDLTLPFFFFWFGASMPVGTGVGAPGALATLILWALAAKLAVGFWGGRMYGLSFKGALRAAFSLVPRGEFSVVIAALAEPVLRVFLGIHIVVTAILGVYLFRRAPGIADRLDRARRR